MTKVTAQDSFRRMATRKGLSTVNVEDLKQLALAVWYEDFTPDMTEVPGGQAQCQAAYLLDRLLRYPCVEAERKRELHQLVMGVEVPQADTSLAAQNTEVESLARKWGLTEDLSEQMAGLLEYQTRHYKHEVAQRL